MCIRDRWHSTQRRSVGQLTHIIGGVHLGVEDVLQQGNANAYDEAENQARGQIQRNVRGALPGRSLSLLHYRELDVYKRQGVYRAADQTRVIAGTITHIGFHSRIPVPLAHHLSGDA